MPLPLLFLIPSAIAFVIGATKSVSAVQKGKEADATMEVADREFNSAKKKLDTTRKGTSKALEMLGRTRLEIWSSEINDFLGAFSKIKNVSIPQGVTSENASITSEKIKTGELQKISTNSGAVLASLSGASSAGLLAGVGAYSGVGLLASASTGTAISTLSGAAATNATLAWLGGGSLATGGFGMAGGLYVLGGAVLGPALLVGGFVMDSKAEKRLAEARATLAKSEKAQAQMNRARTALSGVKKMTESMNMALKSLARNSSHWNNVVKNILKQSGSDYKKYNEQERHQLYAAVEATNLMVSALETPLLTEKGNLKRNVSKKIEGFLQAGIEDISK